MLLILERRVDIPILDPRLSRTTYELTLTLSVVAREMELHTTMPR